MQEVEYQFWVREQERKRRGASHPVRIRGSIPKFSMAFQPIVDAVSGTVFAYESLVRSLTGDTAHSVLSRVPRRNFHLFDKACRSRAMLVAMECGLLNRPDQKLCVNVNLKQIVNDYRSCGVQIAMDDFGAGYSGLKLLSKLQPDIIKIDMGLVSKIDTDRTSQVIVRAIVQACHELNIIIVAEGVERYDQAMRLRDIGVIYQQGYYFARPVFERLPDVNCALPEIRFGA